MKATDITGLVKGLLVIIGLAISMGRYDDLQKFARSQARESIRGWKSAPFFYNSGKKRPHKNDQVKQRREVSE